MDYKLQRRLAAEVFGVGESRIWISPDPEHEEEISQAVTRRDIVALAKKNIIRVEPKKGNSRERWLHRHSQRRKGRRRGYGKRKGAQGARINPKEDWIHRIRKMRRYLRWLRDHGVIDRGIYRRYYRLAKGGAFRSLGDLRRHLAEAGLLKEGGQ